MPRQRPHSESTTGEKQQAETSRRGTGRQLTCARCGTALVCHLDDNCWCASEPFRLPLPESAAEDCLCPTCLRTAAQFGR